MEKIKRSDSYVKVWFITLMFIFWTALGCIGLINLIYPNDYLKIEVGFYIFTWSFIECLVMILFKDYITHDQKIQDHCYCIYEYERWIEYTSSYEKRYHVIKKEQRAKFVFHILKETYITFSNDKEIIDDILYHEDNNNFNGYYTEKDAMENIIAKVRSIIANEKTQDNINIRLVKLNKSFSDDEIRNIVINNQIINKDKSNTDVQ